MGPPVVITGASGFIGGSLTELLGKKGIETFALTRQATASSSYPHVHWKHVDEYSDFTPPDGATLIHLAEPPHVMEVDAQGDSHVAAMENQAIRLLDLKYGSVIYASSATVYGDSEDYPRRPDEPVLRNPKVYAQSKLRVEKHMLDRQGICARITNIYGPNMSGLSIFSDILGQLPEQGPLIIRELSPLRDYLWIDDLAQAFVQMIQAPVTGIYNIATANVISCGDLAQMILSTAGQEGRLVVGQSTTTRQSVLKLDISSTIRDFQWQPKTLLRTGIHNLVVGSTK